ncbi:hypothetical protein AB4043_11010, partial [Terriglobus sp. YAF25]|uniref:hypothetical protein n=1 Tax=Terriglobus sp. YAF25 TaxID=3233080 RepID=UPI003F9D2E6E
MTRPFTRRELLFGAAGMTAAAVCPPLFAAPARKLQIHIGYTGITWMNDQIEQAVDSVSSLGFYGFETFGDVLSKWKAQIHIGYTGITWMNDQIEQAVDSVSSLGFYGFETFGDVLSKWKA